MEDHVAILIKENDQILFIKRSEQKKTLPNIWAFPSGTKEENETIETTAVREAEEELGVKVRVENILTTKDLPEFNVRLYFMICSIQSGIPEIMDYSEISELKWLSFSQFFQKYPDDQIGHGLIFLRQNPNLWKN